ncbi:uncharacterized protein [Littorina saxatilis]|uniref:Uncharacterized protein n=1 Tax=Littorina saxatilis TaxID=31220 RepID=A0AAN9G0M4_9CAEN
MTSPAASGTGPTGSSSNHTEPDPTSSVLNSSSTVDDVTGRNNSSGINGTALPATGGGSSPGLPGGVIALLFGLLVLGIAIFCIILYLKRTGRLYRMVPFKPLTRYRRSSTSSDRGPLDMGDDRTSQMTTPADHEPAEDDSLPPTREGNMFTIDDHETEPVDLDSQSRGTNDEYYYDEVFGKSVFEDEATNASMRELYLAGEQDDEDMFDVDAIVSSITGTKGKSTKT